eukprot:2082623-Pleurochrysis_carterae.AAC.1
MSCLLKRSLAMLHARESPAQRPPQAQQSMEVLDCKTSAQPRKKPGVDGARSAKSRNVIQKRGGSALQKRRGIVLTGSTTYERGYDSSQMQQLLGLIALREQRTLKVPGR